MNLEQLRSIGLTKGEIKVYQALLELGECTKTALAKQSKVTPSNIYDITNRLLEKGIISKITKNGVAHFSPAHPRHLLSFLERKQEDIETEKQVVASLFPMLLKQFEHKDDQTTVEHFQGWNGLKTVFEDLLAECGKGDENFVFGASRGEQREQADRFFSKYSKRRAEQGILTRIIFNEDVRTRRQRMSVFVRPAYDVRFLAQSTPTEVLIYKNRTCIIMLLAEPLVVRITSKEAAASFKQYFDALWKIAKK
ncbi:MAG TPA: helix-turn-helix domain-containing protein [Candidatus Nanoarchaeia archaeon]|nr:hypothetical protein [Candidatus Woesearchaeota archaeon]HLC32762.1 helix-turn-helix domain-containing protein [Candidatus Nanoarchaeia archaeon]